MIAELMDVLREMSLEEGLANPLEKNITTFHEAFLNSVKKTNTTHESIGAMKPGKCTAGLVENFSHCLDAGS